MKTIVVCCDGTGQKFDGNKTNPLKFYSCLRESPEQRCFYDPGVGTFDPERVEFGKTWLHKAAAWLGKVRGKALGHGIVRNITDAYRYLMNVYEEGDRVVLIGFSRGAFTVEALAGLLRKCGLLLPDHDNLLPYAIEMYLQSGNEQVAADFKDTVARSCRPSMIGVWDTVASLGPFLRSERHFLNGPVGDLADTAYKALSIDERRRPFAPSRWLLPEREKGFEEVWFAGVHSDVGGGYAEAGLAHVPLQWMIRKAQDNGVAFDHDRVKRYAPEACGKLHNSLKWYYWVLVPYERPIPQGVRIHESVETRRQHCDYAPGNLPNSYEVDETPVDPGAPRE
ncbi:Uncharacterized alpha/beta hydrolase domain [Limimonas halophila]|uniref:Uncharacterized alpha/beta hydrolase domain n=1 Tax=Limimonas halophila TaxID=1082479 RepID=A0A1G7SRF9_9PROT|nr:DUF2235 domain-containing protein [Limimonas halophila]SDG25548.1 Uncharacterized alpha/beta hydrolase domain [Limimonas halophila]